MAVRIQNIKNVVKIAILQNHGEETNHLMKEGVCPKARDQPE
jgi:hypothetical protein